MATVKPTSIDDQKFRQSHYSSWLSAWTGQCYSKRKALDELASSRISSMPTPWAPDYKKWKVEFEKYKVTNDTLLIGHSCGATFLIRWLLDTANFVKKLILVAPAYFPETKTDKRRDLYNFKLTNKAANIAGEIVIFISNDFAHHLKSFEFYRKMLNPRVIELQNKGHFLIFTMGTNKFPELLNEVIGNI